MSFKDWSAAQKTKNESKLDDKSEVAPATAQSTTEPDPAVVGPANKT